MARGCRANWLITSVFRLPSDTDRVTIMPVEEPPEADIAATPSETDYYKDINNVYGLLTVDPM